MHVPGVSGVCIIAGVVRPCSDTEMNVATHDAILVPGKLQYMVVVIYKQC